MGIFDELEKYGKDAIGSKYAEAVRRAQYKVQDDFRNKLVKHIANKTGHENLAKACYFDVEPVGGDDYHIDMYYDASYIEGYYESYSSYHQDGGKWRSVRKNYNLSRYDFWDMHYAGETGGSYGEVEEEWIMDNFWNGREYVTNGWPLSKSAEYLSTSKRRVVSAKKVTQEFYDDYERKGYYEKYIQQEFNRLKKT